MKELALIFAAVIASTVTFHLVRGDVEATLARCCALGSNWAREEHACASFPTPVSGEASEHQSICLTAASICCLRLYREEQCEAGKQAAQKGRDCRLPATQGGEYYKVEGFTILPPHMVPRIMPNQLNFAFVCS
ncbi:hypothetical protein FHG87_022234 [Trinorchestia longiramus]|nr:hypothetical protein FHG87_022234 [Trinorchestia longiramus]